MKNHLRVFLHNTRATWILLTLEILVTTVIYTSAKVEGLSDVVSVVVSCSVGAFLAITDRSITRRFTIVFLSDLPLEAAKEFNNHSLTTPSDASSLRQIRNNGNPKKNMIDTELLNTFVHSVVTQVAPNELPFFPAVSAAYIRNPRSVRALRTGKASVMGFGVESVVSAVTPIVFFIVQNVLNQMAVDAAEKGATTLLQRLNKKFFKRPSSTPSDALLYTLPEIREYAYKTALDFRVADTKAQQIADVIVGKLATRQDEKDKMP